MLEVCVRPSVLLLNTFRLLLSYYCPNTTMLDVVDASWSYFFRPHSGRAVQVFLPRSSGSDARRHPLCLKNAEETETIPRRHPRPMIFQPRRTDGHDMYAVEIG